MPSNGERISEEAARAVWRRAAELQAEAERRLEERARWTPAEPADLTLEGESHAADDVRVAAEEAGIAPEFVQIALAEAAASATPAGAATPRDFLGARFFLGASRRAVEVAGVVPGSLNTVAAACLQVFSGHPCLLQAGEVAEMPSAAGRVIVLNVPKYDWGATANPPFIEKASTIGLRQLHLAIRPIADDPPACEVIVAGDLRAGMRNRWRWSAATSAGASVAGGAAGVGLAGSVMAGALLALPAFLGAAVLGGAAAGAWAAGYRYYRGKVEEALKESLELLPAAARAIVANQGGREPARRAMPAPQEGPELRR